MSREERYSYAEHYAGVPRVSSSMSRTIYAELESIGQQVDFRLPRYMTKAKRNRSMGSVVALVCEVALSDPVVRELFHARLKLHMKDAGAHWTPSTKYTDVYFWH